MSIIKFSSVQLVAQSCPTHCDPMDCSTWGSSVYHQFQNLFKLMSIKLVMTSSHLILCQSFLLLPLIFPSIRVYSNESVLSIRWKNIGNSAASSVLRMNMQNWFPLFWLVWSPCSQRDSITPQFKGINSLAPCFLCSLTQTSIHDYWNKLQLWPDGPLSAK